MYFLYSALSLALVLFASPWFIYQAVRYRKYVGSLPQRFGYLPLGFNLDGDDSIWLHAVSVGEVLAARALVPELRERYPDLKLFVSTTTMTGQQVARQHLVAHVDALFYFPFDLAFIVRRTLNLVRPRLFVMVETEIWPNLLRECRARGVKTVLVNGRLSARSFRRYRLVRPLFRRVLAHVDRFCVQSELAHRRFIALGADPSRVVVTGNLKFDALDWTAAAPGRPPDRVLRYFRVPADRPVLIAASTLRGEELPILRAYRRAKLAHPSTLLVIAPRHPQRFDEVVGLAAAEGYRVVRRTELMVDAEPRADVVVLDTMGELARLFQIGWVVFVGGSLVEAGGHNILEPALFGKPIVVGPHMDNFAEIADTFLAEGAAIQVQSPGELEQLLPDLLADPVRRAALGAAARALVESNRGAKDRTLDAVAAVLPPGDGRRGVIRPFRRVQ